MIVKETGLQTMDVVGWDPDIYVYTPGTLPTVPVIDQTVQPPSLTSFTVSSSGVDPVSSDGKFAAFFILQMIVPASSAIQSSRVRYRRNSTTTYGDAQPVMGTGTLLVKVGGLEPGLSYDFEAATVSGPNESTASTISNQLAPGDTTGPGIPTTPTFLGAGKLSTATFYWTPPADQDRAGCDYEIRTGANGTGSIVLGASNIRITTDQVTIEASAVIGYGVTRHFRVRYWDRSNNPGTWSLSAPFSFTQAQAPDYGNETVGTIAMVNLAISTGKIAIGAVTQRLYTAGGGAPTLTGSYQTILSQVVTSAGGTLETHGAALLLVIGHSTDIQSEIHMRLRNTTSGVVSNLGRYNGGINSLDNIGCTVMCVLQETPGAGTYTIVLEALKVSNALCQTFLPTIAMKELKR